MEKTYEKTQENRSQRMESNGIYESKYGSENIADNLKNYKEFAVTTRGLRDHFTIFMKRYKSKTRREVKGSNILKT